MPCPLVLTYIMTKLIFIVGPTAVGKSRVALTLCEQVQGEIISCDSMQVYREIAIASAKPNEADRKRIPHHLLDMISVEEEFDVVRFKAAAEAAIRDIHTRGRIPVLVGGSGLYMQVLLDGIFEGAPKDEGFRERLRARAEEEGNDALYEELNGLDPLAAAKIHPHDAKRIIRALEVMETEKQPISELQKEREGLWGKYDIKIFCLNMDREKLYGKINERVDAMCVQGLVDEINALAERSLSCTADRMIGVREIQDHLKGMCSVDEAKELIKQNTRHFAKRQLTWFRKEQRLIWIDVTDRADGEIVNEIKKSL